MTLDTTNIRCERCLKREATQWAGQWICDRCPICLDCNTHHEDRRKLHTTPLLNRYEKEIVCETCGATLGTSIDFHRE